MGRDKGLRNFDKGQIIIARTLGNSMWKMVWLVNCGEYLLREVWGGENHESPAECWAAKICPCKMWILYWLLQQESQIILKMASVMTCQDTRCTEPCGVPGCIATDHSGCPCWLLSTFESAYNGHAGIDGAMDEGLMNPPKYVQNGVQSLCYTCLSFSKMKSIYFQI